MNHRRRKTAQTRLRRLTAAVVILTLALLALLFIFLIKTGSLQTKWNHSAGKNSALEEVVRDLKAELEIYEADNKELLEKSSLLTDENRKLKEQNTELTYENLALKQRGQEKEAAYRAEVINGLADVQALDSDIIIDLRYADEDNFMNRQVYPDNSKAFLRRETAVKLIRANEIFKEDGYTIKIWDAYRPLSVQRIMWEHSPLPGYVAHPDTGSKHNRGAAVDIALVDKEGNELEMPTGFDDFTEKAARDYPNHSPEAKKNMDYMTRVMVSCGFKGIRTEWWHFDDVDANSYPLLDVGLEWR